MYCKYSKILVEKIKDLFMHKFHSSIITDNTYDMERLILKQQIIDSCNKITNNCIDTLISIDPIQLAKYMPLLNYEDMKQDVIIKLEDYYLYEHEIISAFNSNTENSPEIQTKITKILKIVIKENLRLGRKNCWPKLV